MSVSTPVSSVTAAGGVHQPSVVTWHPCLKPSEPSHSPGPPATSALHSDLCSPGRPPPGNGWDWEATPAEKPSLTAPRHPSRHPVSPHHPRCPLPWPRSFTADLSLSSLGPGTQEAEGCTWTAKGRLPASLLPPRPHGSLLRAPFTGPPPPRAHVQPGPRWSARSGAHEAEVLDLRCLGLRHRG